MQAISHRFLSLADPTGLSQVGSANSKCRTAKSFVLLHRTIEHGTKPETEVTPVSALLKNLIGTPKGWYFLFVLMWPTWPQFAHLRCVPALFTGTFAGDDGESGSSSTPSRCSPFCLSRAIRRSLLRCSRASSFSSLNSNQHVKSAIMNMGVPLLITPVLLSNAGWFNIGQPIQVSFHLIVAR